MSKKIDIEDIKFAVKNQLMAEISYGAEGETLDTLQKAFSDLVYILEGGYIVNGVRI